MKKRDYKTGIEISDADWQRFEKFLPQPEASPKPPTQDGRKLRRYKIERTHSWLQNYRRLVVRYDNTIQMFDAFLQLACCMLCTRKL
jgi:transposase